ALTSTCPPSPPSPKNKPKTQIVIASEPPIAAAVSKLEDWFHSRYLLLVKEFGTKEFTTEDANETMWRYGLISRT
ncbi:MAG: hypothetical protein ACTSYM_00505, partial [Candidatus Baldrarchaeia archaeon]